MMARRFIQQRFGSSLLTLLMVSFLISGALRILGEARALATSLDVSALAQMAEESDLASLAELNRLINFLNIRESELAERERAVALIEADIAIAKREIATQLEALKAAEDRLSARMAQSNEASAADLQQLTQVYEAMKPAVAAELFAAMDPAFAAEFLIRMTPEAAAAVFSTLPPEAAYALSAVMAGRNANAATERP